MSQIRLKLCAGAMVLLATCSGGSELPVESAQAPENAQQVPDDLEPGLSRITGDANGLSDVQTQPGGPLSGGFLMVLPADSSSELTDLIGTVDLHQMPYVTAEVLDGDLPSAVRVPVLDGAFSVDLANGDYHACLLNAEGSAIRGCTPDVVTVDGSTTWGILTGEGGFELFG